MEELLKILNDVKPGVDYENETDLIGHGVLDSITMVTLVLQLSDEFDVDITPVDITPENFKTVQTIYDMIKRLEDESDQDTDIGRWLELTAVKNT